MPKRCLRDIEYRVTTGEPGVPYQLNSCIYSAESLCIFDFIANIPWDPDNDGPTDVNLVEQGLSPWPVSTNALSVLTTLAKPFSKPALPRVSILGLLECANALGYTCMPALDQHVWKYANSGVPVLSVKEGSKVVDLTLEDDWIVYVDDMQNIDQDTVQMVVHDISIKFKLIVPSARSLVLETYTRMDVLGLERSMRHLARCLVYADSNLLYDDANWRKQLSACMRSLTPEGHAILLDEALNAQTSEAHPSIDVPELQLPLPALARGVEEKIAGVVARYMPGPQITTTLFPLQLTINENVHL
eukprot:jgi/Chrzof1/13086/Cz07g19090.t1